MWSESEMIDAAANEFSEVVTINTNLDFICVCAVKIFSN